MNNHKMNVVILVSFIIAPLIFLNGCDEPVSLQSKRLDKDLVIDANDNEWKDCQLFYDEKTQSTIGIYNDDANLYMCFTTMDQDIQRQILIQGLLIWFNQTGGKDKQLAVRYPIGMQPDDQGPPVDGREPGGGVSIAELQILTSEKDEGKTLKIQEAADIGIYSWVTIDQSGKFIYELTMPLIKNDNIPYAIAESTAKNIGMGFTTVRPPGSRVSGISGFGGGLSDMGSGGGMGGGGMGGGGMGGGGMGGPGGGMGGGDMGGDDMGGSMGSPMPSQGSSLEIWTNITLAAGSVDIQ